MTEKIKFLIKKELYDYFYSIKYYFFFAIYLFLSGYFISNYVSVHNTTNIEGIFPNIMILFIIFIPFLCVISIHKESKYGGGKIIIASPTTPLEILIAKFASIYIISFIGLFINVIQFILVRFIDVISFRLLATTFIGFAILLFALIALNLLFATLTSNPYLNYGIAFFSMVVILLLGYFIDYIPGFIEPVYAFFSLFTDIKSFWLIGKISIYPILHSAVITLASIHGAVMLIEKRWRNE